MSSPIQPTSRTKVKRKKDRASYDPSAIYAAIDDALFATIAFHDGKNTHAIPTAIWREQDHLYIHGSNGSRLIQVLQTEIEVCVSLTHAHGLVLARSATHHSMNYRSVCIYGKFEKVMEENKQLHLQRFLEHWTPGRWQFLRQPDKKELAAVTILHLPIAEAVFKSRQGQPQDLEKDLQQPVWAGIVPLESRWQIAKQTPEQQNELLPGLMVRGYSDLK